MGGRSTAELRYLWAAACTPKGPVYLAAYRALDDVLRRWRYAPRRADTGAYNCRRITGGTDYSLHAYGPGDRFTFWNGLTIPTSLAVDLNWQSNPYGPILRTDMPAGMVRDIEAIRTIGGAQVWRWGGHYAGNKDGMHYEIVCSPAELTAGIRSPSPPTPPELTVAQIDDIIRRLDALKAQADRIEHKQDEAERLRLEPTTGRVRKILAHLGIKDEW